MDSSEVARRLVTVSRKFTSEYASSHLAQQIIRAATAPALIYAEAQDAESTKDFIHKMKLVLKELRETSNARVKAMTKLWLT